MNIQQLSVAVWFIILDEIAERFLVIFLCLIMARRRSLRRQHTNRREIRYQMDARIPRIMFHLSFAINDSNRVCIDKLRMDRNICIDKLRMDRNTFHKLVLLAKNNGGLTDSKYMSSSKKLAMFLNILAHHEKNRSIKVEYVRSEWSVSQAFNECLRAILKLTPLLLVKPKPVLEDEIDYRWRWFKGYLGVLDGTYVTIRVPSEDKPRYRTRKGDIATNVLGVCDNNLNFIYVLPGWEGSATNGRVLRDAVVHTNGLKVPEGAASLLEQIEQSTDPREFGIQYQSVLSGHCGMQESNSKMPEKMKADWFSFFSLLM